MFDKLDHEILGEVSYTPASISDVYKIFKNRISYTSFRERVWDLVSNGLLKSDKQRHYVFLTITKKGLEAQIKEI